MSRLLFLVAALASVTGMVAAQEPEVVDGPTLLAPFKQGLQQALRDGLAAGPEEAIAACRLEAPRIAETYSREGVRLGRTSHRLRNSANVAPEWVVPILEAYADDEADRAPQTVTLPDSRAGYVEPIILQPLCVACHGDDLAPEIASRIRDLYPMDRAVGYRVGDLRGVFWVEFPRSD